MVLEQIMKQLAKLEEVMHVVHPVSYTHLDVYKRQNVSRSSGEMPRSSMASVSVISCRQAGRKASAFSVQTMHLRLSLIHI